MIEYDELNTDTIFNPNNASDNLTSGDEDNLVINNLPASQTQIEVEVTAKYFLDDKGWGW